MKYVETLFGKARVEQVVKGYYRITFEKAVALRGIHTYKVWITRATDIAKILKKDLCLVNQNKN